MYVTIADVRARPDLGLSDPTVYSDDLITSFISKTQSIIDGYIGQNIELDLVDRTDIADGVSNMMGGISCQLPKRFVQSLTSVTIKLGYGQSDILLENHQYQLNKSLGIIDSNFGGRIRYLFDGESQQRYDVEVVYRAGFSPIPQGFIEAFYAVMNRVVDNFIAKRGTSNTSTSTISNIVESYKTLNETVRFAKDPLDTTEGKVVIDKWVERELDKYRMPIMGVAKPM